MSPQFLRWRVGVKEAVSKKRRNLKHKQGSVNKSDIWRLICQHILSQVRPRDERERKGNDMSMLRHFACSLCMWV